MSIQTPGRIVTFGEIMMRVSPQPARRFAQTLPGDVELTFAGAEANAAVAIAHLGGEVSFVTALPDHKIADACVGELRRHGVNTDHIVRKDDGRMGTFFYEPGVYQRAGDVIYDREHTCAATASVNDFDWDAIFDNASLFLISGITPAISRQACEVTRHAMNEAKARGILVALDVNFRSKLWRWDPGMNAEQLASSVLPKLASMADLLICGHDDAVRFLGCDSCSTLRQACDRLIDVHPNVKWIASSARSTSEGVRYYGGEIFVAESRTSIRAPSQGMGYQIEGTVDRLGIGDSFAGALVSQLCRSEDAARAIEFAAAAGCLAHSIVGDFGLLTAPEVDALIASGDQAGRVHR